MTHKELTFDINLLRVLVAIDSNGGISGAARVLNLTQPAITHSLNRLRDLLDDPLFVRQGNKMVATHKTRALIPKVQFHLSGLQAAVSSDDDFDAASVDLLFKLGFRDILESIAFPPLVTRIVSQAPRLKMISRGVVRNAIERDLTSGAIDLMIDRSTHVGPNIRSQYLGDEAVVVIMRADHPLAASPLSKRDYLAATHIVVSPHADVDPLDLLLAEDGKVRRVGLVCQHYFSACQVAAKSDWLLAMPDLYARTLRDVLPIVVRPMPMKLKPMRIEMYWHVAKENDPAHQWFRQLISEVLTAFTLEMS